MLNGALRPVASGAERAASFILIMEKANPVIEERRKKAETLESMGIHLHPAGYKCDMTASEAVRRFGHMDTAALEKEDKVFSVAGRIMAIRNFGKASFIHIKDCSGLLQAYIRKDKVGEEAYATFKYMDIGDFIGIEGTFFRTRTNELTILADHITLQHRIQSLALYQIEQLQ